MDSLVTGPRHESILNCNWTVFWENDNECRYCPGIHPELCDTVPIYAQDIMAANESADWPPRPPPPAFQISRRLTSSYFVSGVLKCDLPIS